jgi:hypothetical protein
MKAIRPIFTRNTAVTATVVCSYCTRDGVFWTTRTYYHHGVTQVNIPMQMQVVIVVGWRSRLAFLLFVTSWAGLRARQLSSGRNCGNANVN